MTTEHRLQCGIREPQQHRHGEDRRHGDADLEQRIGEYRARDAGQEALGEQGAERKPAHVRGQHGGDRHPTDAVPAGHQRPAVVAGRTDRRLQIPGAVIHADVAGSMTGVVGMASAVIRPTP